MYITLHININKLIYYILYTVYVYIFIHELKLTCHAKLFKKLLFKATAPQEDLSYCDWYC